MTKILYSGLVSDQRGKLNGTIFSKNRTGNILKNFASPRNPQSGTQQPNRANWQYIVKYWGSLETIQRASWSDLAANVTWHDKLGTAFHPTGQMLYLYCNQNLFVINQPMLSAAVAPVAHTLISSCSISQNHSGAWGARLSFLPSPVNPNIYYRLSATPALSPGITYAKKYFRQIGILAPAVASPIDITTMYLSIFPVPVSGRKIFIKLQPVENTSGFSSLPVFCDFITIIPTPIHIIPFGVLTFGFSF
jgi:hypothetical protein